MHGGFQPDQLKCSHASSCFSLLRSQRCAMPGRNGEAASCLAEWIWNPHGTWTPCLGEEEQKDKQLEVGLAWLDHRKELVWAHLSTSWH